ncbi:hypothetical protein J2S43_007886 [Catenuloplanes nepalensis]|uniref:Secreted protein n=1 Tax=Catenuloplanes nepalensis TaxID=587533 RepID=A0ABT9N6Q2_9ACTN|nr:hypothetical protein [Catenuloplanes nepalensis]MDP9799374.1 hypothetical protein [Catenuloplanes nepalensis]
MLTAFDIAIIAGGFVSALVLLLGALLWLLGQDTTDQGEPQILPVASGPAWPRARHRHDTVEIVPASYRPDVYNERTARERARQVGR